MKKTLYSAALALSLLFTNQVVNAQAFEKEKSYVSGSYGFGTFFGLVSNSVKNDLQANGTNVSPIKISALGPISVKYEYGVSDKIGLGLNVNYLMNSITYNETTTSGQYTTTEYYKLSRNTISVLARMNVHFGEDEKFDPYWGFGIGYRQATWKQEYHVDSNDPSIGNTNQADPLPTFMKFPFGFETTFGARYLITPNVGAFAELGFAKSFFQVGLTAKF